MNVYYSHHVMGKRKYMDVRKANKSAVYHSTNAPNVVPYSVLSNHINSTDIGTVLNISPEFTEGVDECGEGMYRPLAEYALRLAKFYLHVDRCRTDKLRSFPFFQKKDNNSTLFIMSIGGDGAPGSGCAFLLSFLNVGKRIASSFENFLIFGANVEENSPVVKRFVLKTILDIKYLESKVFDIMLGETLHKVEFVLGELPNDMKMLYFLAGELSNSATYFSTFANVTQSNSTDIGMKMGDDWVPFNYHKRLSDAAKVEKFSVSLEKEIKITSKATKRQKITSYISNTLHSRQEKIPLVQEYVDRAKCEPLHIKNNVVAQLFVRLQKEVLRHSDVMSFKSFNDLPENNLYRHYVSFVKREMNCNQLANKMIAWFNEEYLSKNTKDFRFRFRGIESYSYLKQFPNLIRMILFRLNMENARYRVCQMFLESLYLRKAISYLVRLENFTAEHLSEVRDVCRKLHIIHCVFEQTISPSLWSLCHAAPFHAEITLREYGFGLGCNTMEGREQKHQQISKYSKNTTFQCRWPMIFRHEFIHLVYLRENNFDTLKYIKKGRKYLPDHDELNCENCGLILNNNHQCDICHSADMIKVNSHLAKFLN